MLHGHSLTVEDGGIYAACFTRSGHLTRPDPFPVAEGDKDNAQDKPLGNVH